MAITTQNDYYYKSCLKTKMEEFIEEELTDNHEIGYLPDNISTLMAEAAYNIMLTVKDTNDYINSQEG